MELDPYAELGVTPDAPEEVIKAAWKALVFKHHPDRNPGDAAAVERIKRINVAFELVSTPEARAQYAARKASARGPQEPPPQAPEERAAPPPRPPPPPPKAPPQPRRPQSPKSQGGVARFIGAIVGVVVVFGAKTFIRELAREAWFDSPQASEARPRSPPGRMDIAVETDRAICTEDYAPIAIRLMNRDQRPIVETTFALHAFRPNDTFDMLASSANALHVARLTVQPLSTGTLCFAWPPEALGVGPVRFSATVLTAKAEP